VRVAGNILELLEEPEKVRHARDEIADELEAVPEVLGRDP